MPSGRASFVRNTPYYFRSAKVSPLFDGVADFIALSKEVAPIIKSISKERHIRHAVLDTWCLVDYILRRNLVLILGMQKFETTDFDPKLDLLPRSFDDLLKCLEKFKRSQASLPSSIDPFDGLLDIPLELRMSLDRDPVLGPKFQCMLNSYYQQKRPETWAFIQANPGYEVFSARRPKNLTGAYRDFLMRLDEAWFKRARQLNKARNRAAHTMNEKSVAEAFGFSGRYKVQLLRKECLQLLKSLIGLKKTG